MYIYNTIYSCPIFHARKMKCDTTFALRNQQIPLSTSQRFQHQAWQVDHPPRLPLWLWDIASIAWLTPIPSHTVYDMFICIINWDLCPNCYPKKHVVNSFLKRSWFNILWKIPNVFSMVFSPFLGVNDIFEQCFSSKFIWGTRETYRSRSSNESASATAEKKQHGRTMGEVIHCRMSQKIRSPGSQPPF